MSQGYQQNQLQLGPAHMGPGSISLPPRYASSGSPSTDEIGESRMLFPDCCSSPRNNEIADFRISSTPQWAEQMQRHTEEVMQIHFSRHEVLLQKCLQTITEWLSLEERGQKLDLKDKAKAKETEMPEATFPSTAEAKAIDTADISFEDSTENKVDAVTKAAQEAIAPVYEKLAIIEH